MKSNKLLASWLIGLVMFLNGCGAKIEKMVIPEIGFSMTIPQGWKLTPESEKRGLTYAISDFHDPTNSDYNWGSVSIDSLAIRDYRQGMKVIGIKSLTEYVENRIGISRALGSLGEKLFGTRQSLPHILSKVSLNIDGFEAIEVVAEFPDTEPPCITFFTFIKKDNEVIEVMFQSLKNDFAKYEATFRKSIESIKIKRE